MKQREFSKGRTTDLLEIHKNEQDAFVESFVSFDDAFKSVCSIYVSGQPPAGNREFLQISDLIGRQSELIRLADHYKLTLAAIHTLGVCIPSTMLVPWIHAFLRVIRHCADYSSWHLFDELERRTRDCLEYIASERKNPEDSATYATRINKDVGELLEYLVTVIREAVIRRENNIRNRTAEPIPNPGIDVEAGGLDWNSCEPAQNGAKLNAIHACLMERTHPREMACQTVNDLRNDPLLNLSHRPGRPVSYSTVIAYIRDTPSKELDARYAERINEIRRQANSNRHGVKAYYTSLQKQAERKNRENRRGGTRRPTKRPSSAPPGPCAIPDTSWGMTGGGIS